MKIADTTQELDYLFINGIKATIASADPIWSAQMLEMQLGKRSPGNFEPPIPLDLINNYLLTSSKESDSS